MPIELKTFTALAGVLTNSRKILGALKQANLADQHREMVGEALALVSDIGDRMLEIQSAAVELNEENQELKRKLAAADDWAEERKRYTLKDLRPNSAGPGVFAYELTSPSPPTEPVHFLCTNCYNHGRKSILNREHRSVGRTQYLVCSNRECRAELCIVGMDHSGR